MCTFQDGISFLNSIGLSTSFLVLILLVTFLSAAAFRTDLPGLSALAAILATGVEIWIHKGIGAYFLILIIFFIIFGGYSKT